VGNARVIHATGKAANDITLALRRAKRLQKTAFFSGRCASFCATRASAAAASSFKYCACRQPTPAWLRRKKGHETNPDRLLPNRNQRERDAAGKTDRSGDEEAANLA
jgi:hypothetical protein